MVWLVWYTKHLIIPLAQSDIHNNNRYWCFTGTGSQSTAAVCQSRDPGIGGSQSRDPGIQKYPPGLNSLVHSRFSDSPCSLMIVKTRQLQMTIPTVTNNPLGHPLVCLQCQVHMVIFFLKRVWQKNVHLGCLISANGAKLHKRCCKLMDIFEKHFCW